ncbi:MAG: arginase family protein [Promethearchaeota archaeon]
MTFFDFGEVIDFNTEFAIFGIPWDYLTSIDLPNSAIAPQEIRKVTQNLALTTELGNYIPELKAVDLGDVDIKEANVEHNLKLIKEFVEEIYHNKEDIIPIIIGGDHFCSFPTIKTVGDHFKKKDEFGVLIFDSHLDLYEEWDKGVFSHATISHRIFDLDYINNKNILIVGSRDIDIPELEIAESENIKHIDAYLLSELGLKEYIGRIIKFFQQSNVKYLYISIDIDALDPSIAPGTGFAIPGGFSYREMWRIMREVARNFNIIAFDVVEVAPNLDLKNKLTCNLTAKLIVEIMSFIKEK